MAHHTLQHGTNQTTTSNLHNIQVDPCEPLAKILDAPIYKQILGDTTAAVGQLGRTSAIKEVVQPDFVVEPAAHLMAGDKGRGLGQWSMSATGITVVNVIGNTAIRTCSTVPSHSSAASLCVSIKRQSADTPPTAASFTSKYVAPRK